MVEGKAVSSREAYIDALRWVGMIGVVIQHVGIGHRYPEGWVEMIRMVQNVFGFCVLLFFFISGYITKFEGRGHGFMLRRTERLIPPYLFASGVSFIGLWMTHAWLRDRVAMDAPTLSNFATRLATGQGFGPQYYFLPYLLLISALAFLGVRFLGRRGTFLLSIGIAIGAGALFGFPEGSTGPKFKVAVFYFAAFCVGALFRVSAQSAGRYWWSGALALLFGGGFVFWSFGSHMMLNFAVMLLLVLVERKVGMFTALFGWAQPSDAGAVFLWHAPIILPAWGVILGLLTTSSGIVFTGSVVLSVLAAAAVGRILNLIPGSATVSLR